MERFVSVILDISHQNVDRPFTYRIPEELLGRIVIGSAVKVEFGVQIRTGYVLSLEGDTELLPEQIKDILELAPFSISPRENTIRMAIWMKKRFGCTWNRALMTVMPVKNRVKVHRDSLITLKTREEALAERLEGERKTAWARVIRELASQPGHTMKQSLLCKKTKVSGLVVERLKEEGYISRQSLEGDPLLPLLQGAKKEEKILTKDQAAVLEQFCKEYEDGPGEYLLHGVTGSGKTLVFLKMMEHVIAAGRQVIYLIPEISLTYQSLQRAVSFFGSRVALIHSKLSGGERFAQFEKIKNHEADVMIGPRSALFAPVDALGLIVIDEEHDSAYKNENIPRFHTGDAARELARITGASLVLASATPSPETYARVQAGKIRCFSLPRRAVPGAGMARVQVVDMRQELREGNRSIFSRALEEKIGERLKNREQVMLFMNRRGYSTFVSCRSCGEVIKCRHCDVALRLHNNQRLICHYCGFSRDLPKVCPSCGSQYIAGFGVGTQKLEVLTQKAFPTARVLRLDTDSSAKKEGAAGILSAFSKGEGDILIGTQMIVKGHDFERVTLVGIMAADTSLYVGSYTAAQRTFELITQAAGRAGRRDLPGEALIQTYSPNHYAIRAAARQDYQEYISYEMAFRKIAAYPPYVHMMTVQFSAREEEALNRGIREALEVLRREMGIRTGEPVIPGVYRVNDYYRKLLYIKNSKYDILLGIKEWIDRILENRHPKVQAVYDFS